MSDRIGYRGYVASRPLTTGRAPQHIQNVVIRDYARRKGLHYLLSAVEYTMPGCFMMLEDLVAAADQVRGIICYSLFMLPGDAARRQAIYHRLLAAGTELHAAVEDMVIASQADIGAVEDILLIQGFLDRQGKR